MPVPPHRITAAAKAKAGYGPAGCSAEQDQQFWVEHVHEDGCPYRGQQPDVYSRCELDYYSITSTGTITVPTWICRDCSTTRHPLWMLPHLSRDSNSLDLHHSAEPLWQARADGWPQRYRNEYMSAACVCVSIKALRMLIVTNVRSSPCMRG